MPIQGFSRMRLWQFGRQGVHGTAVTPTRRVATRGVPTIEPNWTMQDGVDVGSIDPLLPDYRTQTDITATLTGALTYDDIPWLMAAGVRGGQTAVTSSSTYQWTHQALSLTATSLDEFTSQFSDDVTTDGWQFKDGLIESLELSFDESLGPWQFSSGWRWGSVTYPTTPTTGLAVGSNLPLVFGADSKLYIDSTSGGIGSTLISDALHKATITITNTIDVKRFANGTTSRFAVGGYGLAGREITATFTFAKTSATVGSGSEAAKWLSDDPTNRYIKLNVTSQNIIASSIPYSWDLFLSGAWTARADEEVGGNSVVTLTCRGRYDAGLGYALKSYAVNNRASL